MQGRPITWISIKTPRNIQVNSLLEINLDRQLLKGLIPLDILHNIQHKQPQEMLILLLNVMNSVIKLQKNTILGSIAKVDNAESVQNVYSLQHHNVKDHIKTQPSKPLLPVFPNHSSYPHKPYILYTDASNNAYSSVLCQMVNNDQDIRPVAYFSDTFTAQNRSWCATVKEAYAVLKSVQHFGYYL